MFDYNAALDFENTSMERVSTLAETHSSGIDSGEARRKRESLENQISLSTKKKINPKVGQETARIETQLVKKNESLEKPIPKIKHRDPSNLMTFSPLQEWEGYVTAVGQDKFIANIIDKTASEMLPTEEMEFQISDLSEDDQAMLKEGAIFRWSIGYLKLRGTKKKTSEIVFRRLPAFSKSELNAASERVKRIQEAIIWA